MTNSSISVNKSSNFGDLNADNSTVQLGSGQHTVGSLKAQNTEIVVSDIGGTSVSVEKTADGNSLTLRATADANDAYANADAALADLKNVVYTTADGQKLLAAQTLLLDEGDVNDGKLVTFDQNGNIVSETTKRNTTVETYGAANVLTTLLWRDTMNDLNKRMGELRDAPEGIGAWARVYGGEQEYGAKGVTMKSTSLQVGLDTDVGMGWKVGGAFTYSDGDSTYTGGSADHKSYGIAAYGSWLGENGHFVDLIAKVSRLENDFSVSGVSGDYDDTAWSISAEYGKTFEFAQGAFVEPQLELIYGRLGGADFNTNTGMRISQDAFESLIGRAGLRIGFKFPEHKGAFYAKASVLHDFKGDSEATISRGSSVNKFLDDLGGTWYQFGFGANFNWTDNTYTYVDLERTDNGAIKDTYKWSVGLRHTF